MVCADVSQSKGATSRRRHDAADTTQLTRRRAHPVLLRSSYTSQKTLQKSSWLSGVPLMRTRSRTSIKCGDLRGGYDGRRGEWVMERAVLSEGHIRVGTRKQEANTKEKSNNNVTPEPSRAVRHSTQSTHVKSPVLQPWARSMDSTMAAVLPLPLEPAMCMTLRFARSSCCKRQTVCVWARKKKGGRRDCGRGSACPQKAGVCEHCVARRSLPTVRLMRRRRSRISGTDRARSRPPSLLRGSGGKGSKGRRG